MISNSFPQRVKEAYLSDDVPKTLRVVFLDSDLPPIESSQIDTESLTIDAALCDGGTLKFGKCSANKLELTAHGLRSSITGKRIKVFQSVIDDSEANTVSLGTYVVASCKKQANTDARRLVCYDALYAKNLDEPFPSSYNDLNSMASLVNAIVAAGNLAENKVELTDYYGYAGEILSEITLFQRGEIVYMDDEIDRVLLTSMGDYLVRRKAKIIPKSRLDLSKQIFCKVEYNAAELSRLVNDINNELRKVNAGKTYTVETLLRENRLGVCNYYMTRIWGEDYLHFLFQRYTDIDRKNTENILKYSNTLTYFIDLGTYGDDAIYHEPEGIAIIDYIILASTTDFDNEYHIIDSVEVFQPNDRDFINSLTPEQVAAAVVGFSENSDTIREAMESLMELQGVFVKIEDDRLVYKELADASELLRADWVLSPVWQLGMSAFDQDSIYQPEQVANCWYDEELNKLGYSGVRFKGKIGKDEVTVEYNSGYVGSGLYYDLSSNLVLKYLGEAEKITQSEIMEICRNLFAKIQSVRLNAAELSAVAKPWINVGDRIVVSDGTTQFTTYILEKNTSGIVSMYDEISTDSVDL